MTNLSVNEQYNGIFIQVNIDSRLNILVGNSGTGKTLLLSALDLYCLNNNISCRLCNYNDASLNEDQLINICSYADVLLLDNADLYLTNDILMHLLNISKIIVISMEDISNIDTNEAEQYLVDYNNTKLSIRKL